MDRVMLIRGCALIFVATLVALVAIALGTYDEGEAVSARQAQATGFRWVGVGAAETPRRDGDEWEVDVKRPNGSLVEVTIGDQLELRGLDEELGPGAVPASDELAGSARERAMDAALIAVGSGRVFSVERESSGSVEVNVRRPDGTFEAQLDSGQVVEVEPEDPGDE
jgi:hypothetical protein